jgi:hypothetical protein
LINSGFKNREVGAKDRSKESKYLRVAKDLLRDGFITLL